MTLAITLIVTGLVVCLIGIGFFLFGFKNFHKAQGFPKSAIIGMFLDACGGLTFILGIILLAIELLK